MNDARSASVGLNLTDAGVVMTVVADFTPESRLGKIVSQGKSTEGPLITGLPPGRKYFYVAGGVQDPQATGRVLADILDPIKKELAKVEEAKAIGQVLDAWQKAGTTITGYSMGYVVPGGQPGVESLFQEVAVAQGDSAALHSAGRQTVALIDDLIKKAPKNATPGQPEVSVKRVPRTVAGANLDETQFQLKFPANDPNAKQMQQELEFIYGKNNAGLTFVTGPVGPKTSVVVQGGSEDLIAEAIAAAKANQPLAEPANVKAVAAQLPKSRSAVAYVELDGIINTGVRYAKDKFPLNLKSIPDLPPIGMSSGNEQSAVRVDVAIPMDLVKGMVSWGIESKRAMENNPNGGL